MPRANVEKTAAAAGSKESRFCEFTSSRSVPGRRAVVRIELGDDISIEIRNADRTMLESYMLEVLTKSC